MWLTYSFTALRKDKLKILMTVVLAVCFSGPGNYIFGQIALSLPDAIRLSQEHSYSIKSSRLDSLSANYDLWSARANRFPTLSLSATSFYINKLQSISIPFFGARTLGVKDNYQADLRMTMPLYTGGRISNQIRVQQEIAIGKSFSLQSERLDNAYLARKAYLGLMAAQTALAAELASASRLNIIRKDVENLYKAGMADSVDILDSEISLEKCNQAVDERRTALKNAASTLARLVGLAQGDSIVPADSVPAPDFGTYKDARPTMDQINRPELKALQSRVQAANAAARLNTANYFPTLAGYGGYSYGRPNKDLFNHTWNDYWTAGLNLNWDFNLGGGKISNVHSARAAAISADMTLKDLQESIMLLARTALQNLTLAYNSYLATQRQLGLSGREFGLAQKQQRAGKISTNRLLELEAGLTSTEQLFQASMINYYISETEYLYAIGSSKIYGGF